MGNRFSEVVKYGVPRYIHPLFQLTLLSFFLWIGIIKPLRNRTQVKFENISRNTCLTIWNVRGSFRPNNISMTPWSHFITKSSQNVVSKNYSQIRWSYEIDMPGNVFLVSIDTIVFHKCLASPKESIFIRKCKCTSQCQRYRRHWMVLVAQNHTFLGGWLQMKTCCQRWILSVERWFNFNNFWVNNLNGWYLTGTITINMESVQE